MGKSPQHDSPWQLFARNQSSAETARVYRYQLKNFSAWLKAERGIDQVEDVSTPDLLAYRQHLEDKGLTPVTVKRYLAALRSFFRWCHESGLIETDPAANVRLPRGIQGQEPVYLTVEEQRRLLKAIDRKDRHGRRDAALLQVLAYGLRISEARDLDVDDVIPVDGNGYKLPALRVKAGKGSKARHVPISKSAAKAIGGYLESRGYPTEGPLFVGQYAGREKRLTTRALQKRFRQAAERAGLPEEKHHPHACRHGFGTRLIWESRIPGGVFATMQLMGHSQVATTMRYMHARHEDLERAMMCDVLVA